MLINNLFASRRSPPIRQLQHILFQKDISLPKYILLSVPNVHLDGTLTSVVFAVSFGATRCARGTHCQAWRFLSFGALSMMEPGEVH